MIDIKIERLVRLSESRGLFPERRGGSLVSLATLHRWIKVGIDGIRLETALVGGMRYTSKEAIERFIAATTAASGEGTGSTSAGETVTQRSRRTVRAAAEARAALYPEPKRTARRRRTATAAK